MNVYDVIKGVRLTEAATKHQEKANVYVFEVDPKATKPEIRNAVKTVFGKEVADVRTAIYSGKIRRKGRKDEGRSNNWKKAFVKLKAGDSFDFA
jgi:large subunit ribosomal protein L23